MDIPFIYGRLAEKESFIDRVEDRRELKNFLRHGINVILVSPRFIRRKNSTTNLPPS